MTFQTLHYYQIVRFFIASGHIADFNLETPKRVVGEQCNPRSDQGLHYLQIVYYVCVCGWGGDSFSLKWLNGVSPVSLCIWEISLNLISPICLLNT